MKPATSSNQTKPTHAVEDCTVLFWAHSGTFKKKIRFPFCLFSNTYFLETSFYTIWFYIGLFPGRSTRTFEVRLLLEPFGLLKHEKKKSFMIFTKKLLPSKEDFYPISALAGQ